MATVNGVNYADIRGRTSSLNLLSGHGLPWRLLTYDAAVLLLANAVTSLSSAATERAIIAIVVAGCYLLILLGLDGYNFNRRYALYQQAGLVAVVVILTYGPLLLFGLVGVVPGALHPTDVTVAAILVSILHTAGRKVYLAGSARHLGRHVVGILGDGWLSEALREELESRAEQGVRVVRVPDLGNSSHDEPSGASSTDGQRLSSFGRLNGVTVLADARDNRVSLAAGRRSDITRAGIADVDDVLTLCDAQDLFEALTRRVPLPPTVSDSCHALLASRSRRALHDALDHVLNCGVAAAAILVTVPLWFAIALFILLDDRGPIFFVQERQGFRRRSFRIVKFRTMRVPTRPADDPIENAASRVTRAGALLRKYRLDELPQLLNVLTRDLNLVGPRPFILEEDRRFSEVIPFFEYRYLVRPGITGLAQVSHGYRNDLAEARRKLGYDLYYVKNGGYFLTALILLWSVATVIVGTGE